METELIRANSAAKILFASLVDTTIEFFDFYIYATAAVLVFPRLFFPNPSTATLASLATFGVAFFARPVGALLFGHFGDRIGRKRTLVLALLSMGLSTIVIGLLPTYRTLGLLAPALLALCRFGQGLGLGGEWGGAVLLAVENAPPGRRALYGMFPQLGAPLGFLLSGGAFLLLSRFLTDRQFFAWGWRLPFLASAVLVFVGLYVRLALTETLAFRQTLERKEAVRVPVGIVVTRHWRALTSGVLLCLANFVMFYTLSVFTLTWGTTALGYSRGSFLRLQLATIVFFALGIPLASKLAERGRRRILLLATILIGLFGFAFAPLFTAGSWGTAAMLTLGFSLMGFAYGPLGTALAELFPTPVRYTGSSLAFSLAGILGASLAPYISLYLAKRYGLQAVGWYITASAALTLVGLLTIPETRDHAL